MENADADINGLTNCAKRVSTTNTAGWKCLNPMCSSLRTFGPDFKLAFLMYFWCTMNDREQREHRVQQDRDIHGPSRAKEDGRDNTALLQDLVDHRG